MNAWSAVGEWFASWFRAAHAQPTPGADWKELVETLQRRLDETDARMTRLLQQHEEQAMAAMANRTQVNKRLRQADDREAECREHLAEANAKIAGLEAKVAGLEFKVRALEAENASLKS